MNLSTRANRVWQRMEQLFGPALNAAYPTGMSDAMAQVVDRVDNDAVKAGLAKMKQMRRPPSFMEFQGLMESTPLPQPKPSPMAALTAYATKHLNLTERQLRSPWTWTHEGSARSGSTHFAITGVRIPADEVEGRAEIVLPVDVLHG